MQNGRLQLILTTRYKDLESEADKSAYIENLEVMIDECRKSAAQGVEKVPDSIYDNISRSRSVCLCAYFCLCTVAESYPPQ